MIPLRTDFDAKGLRKLAHHCGDNRQSFRLIALAAAYEGMSRGDAARAGGMDHQTLRDRIMRFNEQGPDGLKDRWVGNRHRRIRDDQMSELSAIVETGPDPVADGVARWRRIDLMGIIEERFGISYSARSISGLLDAMGFSHMSVRPQHPKQDARVIEAFKKTFPLRSEPT